jgi:hypothetical protein
VQLEWREILFRYVIAIYITTVLLISGLTTAKLNKTDFRLEKGLLKNSLDVDLLKLKSAPDKKFVAQNREFKIATPPKLGGFKLES